MQIQDFQIRGRNSSVRDEDVMVVLLNMGGPQTIADVEPFLRRLFNDRLIIRFPFAQSLFADLLIRSRLKSVQHRYGLIGGGSPILKSSLAQVEALREELRKRGRHLDVTLCFNYTEPLPATVIQEIKSKAKTHILPLSLYPHFSLATTASNLFYLKQQAQTDYPQLQWLESLTYHLYEGYIEAFVKRIHETLKLGESLDDFYLLFSAHGTPQYFLNEGDPYAFLISQSVAKITDRLKRTHEWTISYQSDVGPMKWLKPTTGETLRALAQKGIKKVIVVPISFVSDHIETTCEIDMEYRQEAEAAGIEDFRMSKALEAHPKFIESLADCVENSLSSK